MHLITLTYLWNLILSFMNQWAVFKWKCVPLSWESSTELLGAFSKERMLAFCGLSLWRKTENPEKTTDLGWATTTLPHADTGNRTRAAAVTSERHIPALSSFLCVQTEITRTRWGSSNKHLQSMCFGKNKKNKVFPTQTPLSYIKRDLRVCLHHGPVNVMWQDLMWTRASYTILPLQPRCSLVSKDVYSPRAKNLQRQRTLVKTTACVP